MFTGHSLFTLGLITPFRRILFKGYACTANLGEASWLFVLRSWTDSCSSRIRTELVRSGQVTLRLAVYRSDGIEATLPNGSVSLSVGISVAAGIQQLCSVG
jgi:hypothetical protein